jgi:hypothetical protein
MLHHLEQYANQPATHNTQHRKETP